jgi:tRNA(Ile)-lysidine synthetase-like protein
MKIQLPKGRYVVAVSGGVDSVVLLDALSKLPNLELVVAHLDHGIREDSIEDRRFVASLAASYGLVFEYGEGRLGSGASEATAREARYNFLRGVKMKHDAKAIITAHHQDDLIETAILNMLRGTGRKGLTSLS